jgi:hypothetical protein
MGVVEDVAGWQSTSGLVIPIDQTAPNVTLLADRRPDGNNGWYWDAVTVRAVYNDPTSGIQGAVYRINEGDWLNYLNAYEISGEQIHTTDLAVSDLANNIGTTQLRIPIDMSPPTTTISLAGQVTGVDEFAGPVTVTLTGDDPTSGIETTWYRLNGAEAVLYSEPFVVSDFGDHTLEVYSSNKAGLVETSHARSFTIDGTPPQILNLSADCELGSAEAPYINIYGQARDLQSGLASAYLMVEPEGEPVYTFTAQEQWLCVQWANYFPEHPLLL